VKKSNFSEWIVFEDDDLFFVNKPPFLSVLEDRSSPLNLLAMASEYWADAQACHRIDKETSGLVIFAKNPETYRDISILFEARKVEKTYHAVCMYSAEFTDFQIDLPIVISSKGKAKISKKEGKPSQTLVNTLEVYKHFTLLECKPLTGRLHQIRVHLAAVNHPLAADTMYGGELPYLSPLKKKFKMAKGKEETPMINRVALHAHGLSFTLQKTYTAVAPYPNDMDAFVKILKKYDTP
jgi:23S rRNA pseudouridine955/2504/2580 synthase